MNPTNKRSHIHRANKNRTSESDIPAKFKVMEIIKENFGLYPLTDEVIPIPNGIATHRSPDLTIKTTTPTYLIELLGGVHGWEKENPLRLKDIQKLEDLAKLGSEYKLIELWEEDDHYEKTRIIVELYEAGLPINEDGVQHYRNRKVTRYET